MMNISDVAEIWKMVKLTQRTFLSKLRFNKNHITKNELAIF